MRAAHNDNLERDDQSDADAFSSEVDGTEQSLVREFVDFLRENKKWWLTPILLVIGLLMFLVVLSLSPAAPFIYTLF